VSFFNLLGLRLPLRTELLCDVFGGMAQLPENFLASLLEDDLVDLVDNK